MRDQTLTSLKKGLRSIFPRENTRFFVFDPAGDNIYTNRDAEVLHSDTHFEDIDPIESGEVDYSISNPFE